MPADRPQPRLGRDLPGERGGEGDLHPVELQEPLDELARDSTRFGHDLKFPPPEKIRIYDDTLRDGEQMPGVAITPKNKYEDRKSTRLNSSHANISYAVFC